MLHLTFDWAKYLSRALCRVKIKGEFSKGPATAFFLRTLIRIPNTWYTLLGCSPLTCHVCIAQWCALPGLSI